MAKKRLVQNKEENVLRFALRGILLGKERERESERKKERQKHFIKSMTENCDRKALQKKRDITFPKVKS